jgi:hypothetical protein
MNGRQVILGGLLALGGSVLVVIAGAATFLAGDLAALPVLLLGGGLILLGALLGRAGTQASAPRSVVRGRRGGGFGYVPGPTGDYGASYDDDRHHGGTGDPGGWSSGGDSGGGWSFGGGDSGGGWSSGGGGDSGGGGGSS